jgi:hypothetical protein
MKFEMDASPVSRPAAEDARVENASSSHCAFSEPVACGYSIAFQQSFQLRADSERQWRIGGAGRAALPDAFRDFAVTRGPTAAGRDTGDAFQSQAPRIKSAGRIRLATGRANATKGTPFFCRGKHAREHKHWRCSLTGQSW